jgi:hypothetical protein
MTTLHQPASHATLTDAPTDAPTDADAIALLEAMLRIRSESRDESRLAAFLVDRMGAFGLNASIDQVGARGTCSTGAARSTPRGRWRPSSLPRPPPRCRRGFAWS